ncbi:bifunctional nicotinamide mononucleotide adenylyltransferase/ADP-ribose pyrophosphatase [Oleiphilus messinensis]|uniref:Bifunctional nicotinamide mononucleotide adenylyltransferase/ADP-ribose pyrophosphatase n=2 Tax=Oleiphilus messinensis TaxID=141451 RepID=A0A1Y0IC74_9GAMM|nr:bifunctional nicotinamide mononucleotide adenylyltransferase/ADP-ribose pyrophosphatase [Oleiphilus messinensis]
MIRSCLTETESGRVHIAPLMDCQYNDEAWVRNVQKTVQGLVTAHFNQPHRPARVGLIGHQKDHSSYYLKLFPQWGSVSVINQNGINATDIRNTLLREDPPGGYPDLPKGIASYLAEFRDNEDFKNLQKEHSFIETYKSGWKEAPYPPTFVTVDALVIQSGHILLVERKARPGRGLMALPGGFIDGHETLENACLRELREETRLKVPEPVLRGSIKDRAVFDDPHRSARGRTITHAFYFELEPRAELPKVKGGDDAASAFWLPLADLDPGKLFEDHYFIIQKMTGF